MGAGHRRGPRAPPALEDTRKTTPWAQESLPEQGLFSGAGYSAKEPAGSGPRSWLLYVGCRVSCGPPMGLPGLIGKISTEFESGKKDYGHSDLGATRPRLRANHLIVSDALPLVQLTTALGQCLATTAA